MHMRLFHEGQNTRREFMALAATGLTAAATSPSSARGEDDARSLAGVIGLTTGGLNFQRRQGKLTLRSLPRFVRNELGMRLIDLNTHWLEGNEPRYLEQVRKTAEEAGCFFTNLKVNHRFGDLYSHDTQEQRRAMAGARRLIDAAKRLGARWIRFTFPAQKVLGTPPNPVAHRELADYAQQHGVGLLVENLNWMTLDVNAVTRLAASIGRNAAPCPDIGNWADEIRYEGLVKTFPTAVTCDFKALEMDQDFGHTKYDLKRCFQIGWKAGFRGPWVVEHSNEDTSAFIRETVYLRERLKQWIVEAS